MLECGDGDAMVTGLTRNYYKTLQDVRTVISDEKGKRVFGMSIMIAKGRTVFISDTTVNTKPTPEELADIAIQTAEKARELGHIPRVALLSFSNFGNPKHEMAERVRDAVAILDKRNVDFEYEGEIAADVALNPELMKLYPFCRLSAPANVLIMPALHSANIASSLLQELGGGSIIGPVLTGLEKSAQIMPMGVTSNEILNFAALAAVDAIEDEEEQIKEKQAK